MTTTTIVLNEIFYGAQFAQSELVLSFLAFYKVFFAEIFWQENLT
jgi:hypothetical protein